MLTLPGTPVLRYGDEIGMGDDLSLPERNCARTPMQWSDEPHAGFTAADKPCMPVISEGPYGYQHVNVAVQRRDPQSFLNWLERMCRMRKEFPEVGWGDFSACKSPDPTVLILRYDWRNNAVLFLHNFVNEPREVRFRPGPDRRASGRLINVLSEDHSEADARGYHTIVLEPYGYRWFRVGGLDYILRRSEA
jgi:maltose alpha-D-glucosyltransferase/alpha-amylase